MKSGTASFTHVRDTASYKVFLVSQEASAETLKLWIPQGKIDMGDFSGFIGEGGSMDDPKEMEIKSLREERVQLQNRINALERGLENVSTALNNVRR